MGFTPHPADPEVLYASGHPAGGGNLGFIVSRDGGQSWAKLSDGAGGPDDFHQMDISKADPQVIYGRSEEHTSELQSIMRISYAVFCLKKKNNIIISGIYASSEYHNFLFR